MYQFIWWALLKGCAVVVTTVAPEVVSKQNHLDLSGRNSPSATVWMSSHACVSHSSQRANGLKDSVVSTLDSVAHTFAEVPLGDKADLKRGQFRFFVSEEA